MSDQAVPSEGAMELVRSMLSDEVDSTHWGNGTIHRMALRLDKALADAEQRGRDEGKAERELLQIDAERLAFLYEKSCQEIARLEDGGLRANLESRAASNDEFMATAQRAIDEAADLRAKLDAGAAHNDELMSQARAAMGEAIGLRAKLEACERERDEAVAARDRYVQAHREYREHTEQFAAESRDDLAKAIGWDCPDSPIADVAQMAIGYIEGQKADLDCFRRYMIRPMEGGWHIASIWCKAQPFATEREAWIALMKYVAETYPAPPQAAPGTAGEPEPKKGRTIGCRAKPDTKITMNLGPFEMAKVLNETDRCFEVIVKPDHESDRLENEHRQKEEPHEPEVDPTLLASAISLAVHLNDCHVFAVATCQRQLIACYRKAEHKRLIPREWQGYPVQPLETDGPYNDEDHIVGLSVLGCHAQKDGDCEWSSCPQLRDGEPKATGRSCPLYQGDWPDDDV